MMGLDIYLSQLSAEECGTVKQAIQPSTIKNMPLLSWDFFMENYRKKLLEAKKDFELRQVTALAEKFRWKNNLELAFSENDYEAIIITDANQNIIWVNEGFSTMTGYSKKFAINKTPGFLQGKETSAATRKSIREKISEDKPFKEIIVNYKKDKTPYKCEVKIIPLYNDFTTHFIAFEREVI